MYVVYNWMLYYITINPVLIFHSVHKTSEYKFAYNCYGTACTEVEVDVLTGQTEVLRVDILYDCGDRYVMASHTHRVCYSDDSIIHSCSDALVQYQPCDRCWPGAGSLYDGPGVLAHREDRV